MGILLASDTLALFPGSCVHLTFQDLVKCVKSYRMILLTLNYRIHFVCMTLNDLVL